MKKPPPAYDRAMHEARKYWRARLDAMSFDAHLAQAHPRPRPEEGPPRPAVVELALPAETHVLLRGLTGGNPFLSYTALVLALQICCQRHSGRREVTIFGPALAGAGGGEVGELLPLAGAPSGEASFQDALLAVKELLAGAYQHSQYPFSRLVLDLREERRPRHLFLGAAMAGLTTDVPEGACDLALRFELDERGGRVSARFDERLHDAARVRYFLEALGEILQRGLAERSIRVAALVVEADGALAGTAAAGAAGEVGEGAAAAVGDATGVAGPVRLEQLIEARAARHPARVAVVHGGHATTYAALDRRAARLAEVLAGVGLDARRPVTILMDASAEMIAGMLAVLKAGRAFALVKPLSARGPLDRLLAALDPACILCRREHLADLPRLGGGGGGGGPMGDVRVVTVEDVAPEGDAAGEGAAAGSSGSDGERSDVACVMVSEREGEVSTSAVTHAELVRLFQWIGERCLIREDDRCLLSPGLGACEQLHDTLGVLMAGAAVEVADAASQRDVAHLAERLMAPEITVWDLATPIAQNLLPRLLAPALSAGRGPRVVLLTGEKQFPQHLERLARRFPGARVLGLYASPAVGIWSAYFDATGTADEVDAAASGAAIARACPGFLHEVLHPSGLPAPFLVAGELHLRRVGPAAATGGEPASPLVETGLRAARLRCGGRVCWLRGEDHAAAVRGCRVELTRLEALLCEHDDIFAAEVLALRPDPPVPAAEPIVAAFVLADPARVSADAAREHLALRGADLVPDRVIMLDEFPLTAEGAIDRDALLARLAAARAPGDEAGAADTGELFGRVKAIWLETLQVGEVADDDSFFTSGGNSLKATLLIARLRGELGVELSVQQFFREPSVRAVARLVAEAARGAVAPSTPALEAVPRDRYRTHLPGAPGEEP